MATQGNSYTLPNGLTAIYGGDATASIAPGQEVTADFVGTPSGFSYTVVEFSFSGTRTATVEGRSVELNISKLSYAVRESLFDDVAVAV